MAPFLAKILIENKQEVPDFLDAHKPAEGEALDFHDNSEDEDDGGDTGVVGGGNDDAGWGGLATVTAAAVTPVVEEAWGSTNNAGQNGSAG